MPCNYPLEEKIIKLPQTRMKEYRLEGISEDGTAVELHICDNHQRFVKHTVRWHVKELHLIPLATNGCGECRIFDFEVR